MPNSTLPQDGNGEVIQAMAPGTTTVVSFTGSAGGSGVIHATRPTVVRLSPTEDCHILFATDADTTVDTNDMFLPGTAVEYFNVPAGFKVGVIQEDTAGTLYITVMG